MNLTPTWSQEASKASKYETGDHKPTVRLRELDSTQTVQGKGCEKLAGFDNGQDLNTSDESLVYPNTSFLPGQEKENGEKKYDAT